jgi:hypothetical protein
MVGNHDGSDGYMSARISPVFENVSLPTVFQSCNHHSISFSELQSPFKMHLIFQTAFLLFLTVVSAAPLEKRDVCGSDPQVNGVYSILSIGGLTDFCSRILHIRTQTATGK